MMHEFFCNNGCDDFIFDIYGKGSLEASVIRHVENLYRKGIKINYHGYIDSSTVFPNALAVLSLQTYTNYPSRVVAEALVCGCEAIILDSGDSKNFGNQLGIHYLNENLNNISEISMQILSSDQKNKKKYLEQLQNDFVHMIIFYIIRRFLLRCEWMMNNQVSAFLHSDGFFILLFCLYSLIISNKCI